MRLTTPAPGLSHISGPRGPVRVGCSVIASDDAAAMGFFDFRCPISGLSLRAARAVHIALVATRPDRWLPLTLPLVGTYDRLGSIDGFTPDLLTGLLVDGFAGLARAGRISAPSVPDEFAEFTGAPTIDRLLRLFERVNTMSRWTPMPFTLDGCPLRQVLIHAGVFAALAPPESSPRPPTADQLAQQLARAPVAPQARELLADLRLAPDRGRLAASVALTQLTDCTRWLERRRKRWSPASDCGQYGPREDLRFARAARARLAAAPELLPVIDRVLADLETEQAR
jgi:hypothetical protein